MLSKKLVVTTRSIEINQQKDSSFIQWDIGKEKVEKRKYGRANPTTPIITLNNKWSKPELFSRKKI